MRARALLGLFLVVALALGLGSCSDDFHEGTVVGLFETAGGPPGAASSPLRGSISVSGTAARVTTTADRYGHFTVTVPVGTYHLSGRSAQYQGGKAPCAGPIIRVGEGTTAVVVSCHLR